MNRTSRGWLVGAALMVVSCGEGEDPAQDDTQRVEHFGFTEVKEIDGQLRALPVVTIDVLPGVSASFYVWDDLSAGYMMAYASGTPMLAELELEGLSVAEVFWALSAENIAIPDVLMLHHEALVDDNERPAWEYVRAERKQGWLLTVPVVRSLAQCNNVTFGANHCVTGAGYVGYFCKFDNPGYWTNQLGWLRQYRAGFCIDATGGGCPQGTCWASDGLGYVECGTGNTAVIWGGSWLSPTYFFWQWIAPQGARTRQWSHSGYGCSNGTCPRDFGSMWGQVLTTCF